MTDTAATDAALKEILGKHDFWAGIGMCACHYDCEDFDDGHEGEVDAHRRHVAAVLSGWVRQQQAEVLRDAADALPDDGADWYYRDWLLDRADEVSGGTE